MSKPNKNHLLSARMSQLEQELKSLPDDLYAEEDDDEGDILSISSDDPPSSISEAHSSHSNYASRFEEDHPPLARDLKLPPSPLPHRIRESISPCRKHSPGSPPRRRGLDSPLRRRRELDPYSKRSPKRRRSRSCSPRKDYRRKSSSQSPRRRSRSRSPRKDYRRKSSSQSPQRRSRSHSPRKDCRLKSSSRSPQRRNDHPNTPLYNKRKERSPPKLLSPSPDQKTRMWESKSYGNTWSEYKKSPDPIPPMSPEGENSDVYAELRQDECRLEQTLEQEYLVKKVMRKIEELEAETLAKQTNLEQLRKEKLRQEKCILEQTLKQEQESLVNKLMQKIKELEAETLAKQTNLELLHNMETDRNFIDANLKPCPKQVIEELPTYKDAPMKSLPNKDLQENLLFPDLKMPKPNIKRLLSEKICQLKQELKDLPDDLNLEKDYYKGDKLIIGSNDPLSSISEVHDSHSKYESRFEKDHCPLTRDSKQRTQSPLPHRKHESNSPCRKHSPGSPPRRRGSVSPSRKRRESDSYLRKSPKPRRSRSRSPRKDYRRKSSSQSPQRQNKSRSPRKDYQRKSSSRSPQRQNKSRSPRKDYRRKSSSRSPQRQNKICSPRKDYRGKSSSRSPQRQNMIRSPRKDDRGKLSIRSPQRQNKSRSPRKDYQRNSSSRSPQRQNKSRSPRKDYQCNSSSQSPRRRNRSCSPRKNYRRKSSSRSPQRQNKIRSPRKDYRGKSSSRSPQRQNMIRSPRKDDRGNLSSRSPQRQNKSRSPRKDYQRNSSSQSPRRRNRSCSPRKNYRRKSLSRSPQRQNRSRSPRKDYRRKSSSRSPQRQNRSRSPRKDYWHKSSSRSPQRQNKICSPRKDYRGKSSSRSPQRQNKSRSPRKNYRRKSSSRSPQRQNRSRSPRKDYRRKSSSRSPQRQNRSRSPRKDYQQSPEGENSDVYAEDRKLIDINLKPCHSKQAIGIPTYKGAPMKPVPIKGHQIFISASGELYCKLCDKWIGRDLHSASVHLESSRHTDKYSASTDANPHWKIDWHSGSGTGLPPVNLANIPMLKSRWDSPDKEIEEKNTLVDENTTGLGTTATSEDDKLMKEGLEIGTESVNPEQPIFNKLTNKMKLKHNIDKIIEKVREMEKQRLLEKERIKTHNENRKQSTTIVQSKYETPEKSTKTEKVAENNENSQKFDRKTASSNNCDKMYEHSHVYNMRCIKKNDKPRRHDTSNRSNIQGSNTRTPRKAIIKDNRFVETKSRNEDHKQNDGSKSKQIVSNLKHDLDEKKENPDTNYEPSSSRKYRFGYKGVFGGDSSTSKNEGESSKLGNPFKVPSTPKKVVKKTTSINVSKTELPPIVRIPFMSKTGIPKKTEIVQTSVSLIIDEKNENKKTSGNEKGILIRPNISESKHEEESKPKTTSKEESSAMKSPPPPAGFPIGSRPISQDSFINGNGINKKNLQPQKKRQRTECFREKLKERIALQMKMLAQKYKDEKKKQDKKKTLNNLSFYLDKVHPEGAMKLPTHEPMGPNEPKPMDNGSMIPVICQPRKEKTIHHGSLGLGLKYHGPMGTHGPRPGVFSQLDHRLPEPSSLLDHRPSKPSTLEVSIENELCKKEEMKRQEKEKIVIRLGLAAQKHLAEKKHMAQETKKKTLEELTMLGINEDDLAAQHLIS